MFSLIQKMFQKVLSLRSAFENIKQLEERVAELENISAERESLWLFIEEMQQQECEVYQVLEEELNEALVRSMKPYGEA